VRREIGMRFLRSPALVRRIRVLEGNELARPRRFERPTFAFGGK
jgi:hypothetical protein